MGSTRQIATRTSSAEDTILVVDDNDDIRALVRDILTSHGFSVLTATDGRNAVDLFRRAQARSLPSCLT